MIICRIVEEFQGKYNYDFGNLRITIERKEAELERNKEKLETCKCDNRHIYRKLINRQKKILEELKEELRYWENLKQACSDQTPIESNEVNDYDKK